MKMDEGSLEVRWNLKSKLLAHLVVHKIPNDIEEVYEMIDCVFGKDCTFKNVDKQRKAKK